MQNMTSETLTHKDLSRLTGVSVTTIKSYRKKFGEFIPVAGHGKPLRFEKEAGEVCLRIRELFQKGLSVKQISQKLSQEFEVVDEDRRLSETTTGSNLGPEDMDQLLKLSSQMMNGMAALVTAQAKAEKRVERVENKLAELLEIQERNSAIMAELLDKGEKVAEPASDSTGSKMKAKVVTIRSNEGEDKSYRLEREAEEVVPDQGLLELPVVIRSEQGDFLGMPGSGGDPFDLRGLLTVVSSSESGESGSHLWKREGDYWILTSRKADGKIHELHFRRTRTPKGNIVAFFERIDIDSVQQSPKFMLNFFREARDTYYPGG